MSFPYLSDLVRYISGIDLPLPLPMFGLLVGLALLAAAICFKHELRRLGASGEIGSIKRRIKTESGAIIESLAAPETIVSDLTIVVFLAGVVGARLFHIFENMDQFIADPAALIFARSGFNIFGGLILGIVAGIVCIRRWGLPIRPLLDAVAPAMMLGYAIGRIGCQVSGDGDWGIAADMSLKPGRLPSWLWAQTYENNIYGALISPPGVYPTPIYETLGCLALFVVLWMLHKHPYRKGWLFAVYLLLAGSERLLIEQIRVDQVLDFGIVHATQAQMIAVAFILAGIAGMLWLGRLSNGASPASTTRAGHI